MFYCLQLLMLLFIFHSNSLLHAASSSDDDTFYNALSSPASDDESDQSFTHKYAFGIPTIPNHLGPSRYELNGWLSNVCDEKSTNYVPGVIEKEVTRLQQFITLKQNTIAKETTPVAGLSDALWAFIIVHLSDSALCQLRFTKKSFPYAEQEFIKRATIKNGVKILKNIAIENKCFLLRYYQHEPIIWDLVEHKGMQIYFPPCRTYTAIIQKIMDIYPQILTHLDYETAQQLKELQLIHIDSLSGERTIDS